MRVARQAGGETAHTGDFVSVCSKVGEGWGLLGGAATVLTIDNHGLVVVSLSLYSGRRTLNVG